MTCFQGNELVVAELLYTMSRAKNIPFVDKVSGFVVEMLTLPPKKREGDWGRVF
jgi:hypothetical protein